MLSYDTIYKKLATSLEQSGAANFHESHKPDSARHISPVVAHELNNVITVIQGYADQLILKHRDDPAWQPQLKLISKASKRAADIVQEALSPGTTSSGKNPSQQAQSRARA